MTWTIFAKPSRPNHSHWSGMRISSAAASAEVMSTPSEGGVSRMQYSKRSFGLSAWRIFRRRVRWSSLRASSISTPARSISEGIMERFSRPVGTICWATVVSPSKTGYMLQPSGGSMPRPLVQFACGSRSMSSTRWPRSARAAERLRAVVVLPTPPFWLAMATTFMRKGRELDGRTVTGGRAAGNQNRREWGNQRRRRSMPRLPMPKSQRVLGSGTAVMPVLSKIQEWNKSRLVAPLMLP